MKLALETVFKKWLKDSFSLNEGFYANRGPNTGDLNAATLEKIYQGIKKDVGAHQATLFVRFINQLDDFSASAFIVAFKEFWRQDCLEFNIKQPDNAGATLSAYGEHLTKQSRAVVYHALCANRDPERERLTSRMIKAKFIQAHEAELPHAERQPSQAYVYSRSGLLLELA